MSTADLIHVDDELREREARPQCECRHGPDETRCPREADFRVTVLCADDDCDAAAGVYLLCRECLDVWDRQWVRTGQLRLRVLPL